MVRRFSTRGPAYAAIRGNPAGVAAHNAEQDKKSKKREMAIKMNIPKRLKYLKGELNKERISYGELAELQGYKKHLYNDPELAEAAGIPEHEFRKHQK